MPSDLERFLQQAAERLAEKAGGQQPARPRPAQPRPTQARPVPQSVRQAERQVREPEIVEPEIVDAVLADERSRGPDPLSTIDTRPSLAQQVSQADEKMASHIHEALDHDVVNLRDASRALGKDRKNSRVKIETTEVQRREESSNPLIDMLRQPETLRSAFIASEIFGRKFQ